MDAMARVENELDAILSVNVPLDGAPPAVLGRSLEETAASISPDEAAYRRLMQPLVRDWDVLIPEILSPPIHFPSHPVALARFGMRALLPAAGLNQLLFRGERAKALFAGLAGHSIVPLEKVASSAIGLVMAGSGHACGWPAVSQEVPGIAALVMGDFADPLLRVDEATVWP